MEKHERKVKWNMSKRRIYLSGGMSGVERADYVRRFGEAERILRRHGYGCINPCRVWACRWPWIYRAMEWVLGKRLAYAAVLCYDLLLLMTRADGIVNNEAAQVALADNAVSIMANLEESATLNPNGIFFDDEDDEE